MELVSINASVMLSGAKHLRVIFVRRIGDKINPRFFAPLRMTLFANHEFDQCQWRKSKHQDKHASDHQREHPEQIDIEPGVAQYCHPKVFVNHNCDERGDYKIA